MPGSTRPVVTTSRSISEPILGRCGAALPGIHLIFGPAKRWPLGTDHGAVRAKDLQAYPRPVRVPLQPPHRQGHQSTVSPGLVEQAVDIKRTTYRGIVVTPASTRRFWTGSPINFLEQYTSENQSANYPHYHNPEYDKLINDSRKTLDPAARMSLLSEAEQLIMSQVVIIPLFHDASNCIWCQHV